MVAVLSTDWIGKKAASFVTCDDCGVVRVSGQHPFAAAAIGIPNHCEEGEFALCAINGPTGVENFMPAVLRVRLSKHHEFDIARIATEVLKCLG